MDISDYLIKILRIDQGNGDTIVGKIIGVSLLSEKINLHSQKLNGVLASIGQSIDAFTGDSNHIGRYESALFFMNNKGEKIATIGFAENFMYRILEKTQLLQK